jgi:RNA polymerase sigma-70 factor (ECF subfamily)
MDDRRLKETIRKAQDGQAEAFSALLDAYGRRLYGYFYRATGNHHDAEDMLSEVSLRLVRQLKMYDHRGRFEPWLFRIAANMVRDRIRRLKVGRGRAASLSVEDDSGRSLADNIPAKTPGVDEKLLSAEMGVELQAALSKLDETTRQMILLRHFGEMSFKDIAGQFGCPLGTALAKVHRGLKALRKIMGADHGTQ